MAIVSDTVALLTAITRAMVTDKGATQVTHIAVEDGILFRIQVNPQDLGKVIGKQGRVARSLRIVLTSIGKKHGASFTLDVGSRGCELGSHAFAMVQDKRTQGDCDTPC